MFIHAQTHDQHAEECLRFLEAVASGQMRARLEPMVLHELASALPHYRKDMKRAAIADYLFGVLSWDGITGDKGVLIDTVERWRDAPGLAFVDAFLAALAAQEDCVIYSKNITHVTSQEARTSDHLPHGRRQR